jgi:hypothetical protein
MRKVELQGEAFTKYIERAGTGYHLKGYDALRSGRIEQHHESMVIGEQAIARGLMDGTLVYDTRLRDALRALRSDSAGERRQFVLPSKRETPLSFAPPTVADDAAYAVEAAVLSEADLVRLERGLDALDQRLRSLELRPLSGLRRTISLFAGARNRCR